MAIYVKDFFMEKDTGLKAEQLELIKKAKGNKKGIELSKETGIDPRRISKIFNGERKPTLVEAQQLSKALSLPLSSFLSDDRAKTLGQIAVSAGITNGAIIGLSAAAPSIIPGGVGLIAGALISTILSKRKSREFTKQEEYKQDIDDIKKEIKILSKEEREELINLIQECNDE